MDWKITPPVNGKVATVVLIIILVLASIVLRYLERDEDSEERSWQLDEFHYEIEIAPNQPGNYSIIAPIPIISPYNNPRRGEPTQLMYELELIEGNATWEIVNETGDYRLIINATDGFHIVGHREFYNTGLIYSDYVFGDLSMKTSDSNYEIYYNSSSSEKARINMSTYWKRNSSGGFLDYEWGVENYWLGPPEYDGQCWYEVDLLVDKITGDYWR